jgi:hypothetical protein
MTESDLKRKVERYLKKEHPEFFWWKTSDRYTHGIPDIIGCYKGLFVALELKVGKNKPTELQKYYINGIDRAMGISQVCYSMDEVEDFFRRVINILTMF